MLYSHSFSPSLAIQSHSSLRYFFNLSFHTYNLFIINIFPFRFPLGSNKFSSIHPILPPFQLFCISTIQTTSTDTIAPFIIKLLNETFCKPTFQKMAGSRIFLNPFFAWNVKCSSWWGTCTSAYECIYRSLCLFTLPQPFGTPVQTP